MLHASIRLQLDSNLRDAALVGPLVATLCAQDGVPEAVAAEIELCVVEAVTNVITHAYEGADGNPVEVAWSPADGLVRIEVRDRGQAMDPARLEGPAPWDFDADPAALPALDALEESGRGLGIMKALMDELRYERREGWNVLTLVKQLASGQSG